MESLAPVCHPLIHQSDLRGYPPTNNFRLPRWPNPSAAYIDREAGGANGVTAHWVAGSGGAVICPGAPVAALSKPMENAGMVVRITPSEAERNARAFSNATLDKASHCMRTEGALILEDIVSPALIIEAREAFVRRYDRYLNGRKHDDALEVGDRRPMITIDVEPPFSHRELLANSWLCSVLSAAFEDDFILGAYGVVCSLPAAPRQPIHQDGADLFPQAELNRILPIAAVTVGIPLVEMNEIQGTTALWPGSHRDEKRASTEIGDEPLVREGSCVVWDYRLRHCGTPNGSAAPRPLLYMTYCRPWFFDHKNYRKQAPLRAPKRFLAELPEDLRRLLVRAQEC